jgi:hypothetical protein
MIRITYNQKMKTLLKFNWRPELRSKCGILIIEEKSNRKDPTQINKGVLGMACEGNSLVISLL